MRFKNLSINGLWRSYPFRIIVSAVIWFVLISMLHFTFNVETDSRKIIHMGYMPVITNLAAPLLDYSSSKSDGTIRFKAVKFASFAEMAEALRNNEIQAGFIIAPLSIVLCQQGEDVRIVYIGNRHESTLVARKNLNVKKIEDLDGHTVAVPMRFSGHNLAMLKMINEKGLERRIRIVEMNPPDMASALAAGSLDAYFVGEPFAAQTLKANVSDLVFYVEKVWPGFICNLLIVRQEFIENDAETVQTLVQGAVRSGVWAKKHLDQVAQIASQYWGQSEDLVRYALDTPPDRIVFNRYIPVKEEIQEIADLMNKYGLIKEANIDGLVEDRFAKKANLDGLTDDIASIINVHSN